jgi:hypothetical protein
MDQVFRAHILTLLHKDANRRTLNLREVRAFFGLSIPMMTHVCSVILLEGGLLQPKDLLLALHFIRLYQTEEVGSTYFSLSAKTYRSRRNEAFTTLFRFLPDV